MDVGTDLIPAMAGIERPEKGLMDRPPLQKRKIALHRFYSAGLFYPGHNPGPVLLCHLLLLRLVYGMVDADGCFSSMPASPAGLKMNLATPAYLMSLTAYFFPTVTTQIAMFYANDPGKHRFFQKILSIPSAAGKSLNISAGGVPGPTPERTKPNRRHRVKDCHLPPDLFVVAMAGLSPACFTNPSRPDLPAAGKPFLLRPAAAALSRHWNGIP